MCVSAVTTLLMASSQPQFNSKSGAAAQGDTHGPRSTSACEEVEVTSPSISSRHPALIRATRSNASETSLEHTVACLFVFVYLYEAELPPVDSVGHRGQRRDGQQRQQSEGHDAHREVQLHPPHLLVHPGILHALLHLENTNNPKSLQTNRSFYNFRFSNMLFVVLKSMINYNMK